MAETPTGDDRGRDDETAKLELPSLALPGFGRRRKSRRQAPAEEDTSRPAEQDPTIEPDRADEPDAEAPTAVHPAGPPPAEPAAAPLAPAEPLGRAARLSPSAPQSGQDAPDQEQTAPLLAPEEEQPATPAPGARRARRTGPALPALSGRMASVLVGLLVGLLGAALTFAALRGCDAVRGTESCGGGPGLLLLVAVLAVMVLAGALGLALLAVAEPRSTSFLAVGVLCVVALVTLMEQLFSPWMFLVVPLLTGLCFLLAHWVSTTFVEPPPERGPEHDVR